MSIFLDLLIVTFTNYYTFLFLNVLNSKNIYYIVFTGLLIDYILLGTKGIITVTIIVLYFINLKIKSYYFKNILNYFCVLILFGLRFNFGSFIIQMVFIYLMKRHIIYW